MDDGDFDVSATASSGLPVSFAAAGSMHASAATRCTSPASAICTITASQAGNENYNAAPDVSRSFRVAWPFAGFFAPIDNDKENVVQAGRAIPVKFNLGGDRGLLIFLAGAPSSTKVACSSGMPEAPVEQTSTAGQSGLSFGGSQYVYVWKTEKSWAGTCRRLDLGLADTTSRSIVFEFKS